MSTKIVFTAAIVLLPALISRPLKAQGSNCQICNPQGAIFFSSAPACGTSYALAFYDNFDGNSLDLDKWIPIEGVPRDGNFTSTKYWTDPGNVYVNSGNLIIQQSKYLSPTPQTWVSDWSTSPPTTSTALFDYASGEVTSRFTFGYGIYEINCRLPMLNYAGFWPAFWAYGGSPSGIPAGNEIDVFEIYSTNPFDQTMTTHYDCDHDNNAEHQSPPSYHKSTGFTNNYTKFVAVYTPYSVTWYTNNNFAGYINRYVDLLGQAVDCNAVSQSPTAGYLYTCGFPRDPMNIIVDCAIRNGTDAPDMFTIFPNQMEIDYIRYWKPLDYDCQNDYYLLDNTPLVTIPNYYNFFNSYHNVYAQGNVTLANNQVLVLEAGNSVVIDNQFVAENGSTFIAQVDPATCPAPEVVPDPGGNENERQKSINSHFYQAENIEIFPNPVRTAITIDFKDTLNTYKIEIVNAMGQLQYEAKCNSGKTQIDFLSFPEGCYVVKITNMVTGRGFTRKIIKY